MSSVSRPAVGAWGAPEGIEKFNVTIQTPHRNWLPAFIPFWVDTPRLIFTISFKRSDYSIQRLVADGGIVLLQINLKRIAHRHCDI